MKRNENVRPFLAVGFPSKGWGIERDVRIASGHGPAVVSGLLLIDYAGGERAMCPSLIFHAGENYAFTRNTPPERGTVLELVVPEKFEKNYARVHI